MITIVSHCRTAEENKSIFLRVDIVLHGATFFIVFSDADHMPPPYRIDNFSEVKIKFHSKLGSKVLVFIRNSIMPFHSYNYRSGMVNSKSFVGKILLRIKWKFELTYAL